MIIVNNALFIKSESDLDVFLKDVEKNLMGQDKSSEVYKCIEEYFWELWDNSQKLENHLKRALFEDIEPVVMINIDDTEDISLLEFRAVSKKDIEIGKRQQLIFNQLCQKYFTNTLSLSDRFSNVL